MNKVIKPIYSVFLSILFFVTLRLWFSDIVDVFSKKVTYNRNNSKNLYEKLE
jgi:hypothetical protein